MAMCEKVGLATDVQNQYDDTKDHHKCVDFELSNGVCSSRHQKPQRITRLRSTNISHMHISEIACSPRSCKCCSSLFYNAMSEL